MTRHEAYLSETLVGTLRGRGRREVVRQLLEAGLLDRTACERLCIRRDVERLAREGIPRCEAFHLLAGKLCCSYEKVRGLFYKR